MADNQEVILIRRIPFSYSRPAVTLVLDDKPYEFTVDGEPADLRALRTSPHHTARYSTFAAMLSFDGVNRDQYCLRNKELRDGTDDWFKRHTTESR